MTLYVRKYVSPRERPLSLEEKETRRLAYDLKVPTPEAIGIAAAEMAPFVPAGATLIPIPNSQGDVGPNRALAKAIAKRVPCRVISAIGRIRPVESSSARRRRGELRLVEADHGFIRTKPFLPLAPTLFIDNVVTTETTIRAARQALGFGEGLVFADASSRRHHRPANES
jgi:predicted amidophosphoribosyltransferase